MERMQMGNGSVRFQSDINNQRDKKLFRILFAIFGIVPVILLIVTVIFTINSSQKLKTYNECTGTIVDFYETTSSRTTNSHRSKSFSPVVAYTIDGKDYKFVANYYSSSMKIGQDIRILYHSQDHSDAMIKSGLYVGPIILGALTLLFSIFYVVGLIIRKKMKLRFLEDSKSFPEF